jgi:chromosome segregation ATPase
MAASTGEERDPLEIAYAERSAQLYETRVALADAVQTLTDELQARRAEAAAFRAETAAIRDDQRALHEQSAGYAALIENLRERNAELEAELAALRAQLESLQEMRVVRWTAVPRRVLRRLRASK